MKRLFVGSAVVLALVGVTAAARLPERQPATQALSGQPDMKACQDAMARHSQMMKEMQAMDARLQEQVKAMQAAQGQAKVDAIARVVTTLAEQRGQMNQRMMSTHEQMMSHAGQGAAATQQCTMMQHMMEGGSEHQH